MRIVQVLLVLLLSVDVQSGEFTVFTATFLPAIQLKGVEATVYHINKPNLIISRLGHFQPKGQEAAQDAALQMLSSESGRALMKELESSFDGVIAAWANGVERLPAILVDDTYLIYGVFDLEEAGRIVSRFKESRS